MNVFNRAIKTIDYNLNNEINGIPFGLDRFQKYLPCIQKGRYYGITANSGVGKTQWTDAFFMYNVVDFVKKNPNIKLKIFYNSLEISKETKIIQGIGRQMFLKHKKIIPIEMILSLSKSRINEETYRQICDLKDYFYNLEEYVEFFDDKVNPFGIYRAIKNYMISEGTVYKKTIMIDDVEHEVFSHYIPNHSDHYVLNIIDHVGLLNNEVDVKTKQKMDIKGTIEKHSTNMVELRNNFNIIPVDIQQQTAAKESLDSFKQGKLEPSLEGLAETKLTARNWDVAIGVFSPARHEIPKYKGYDITKLKDSYRYINVLKNRYGISNVSDSLFFMGAVNTFYELPKYNDPKINEYYEYAKGLERQ